MRRWLVAFTLLLLACNLLSPPAPDTPTLQPMESDTAIPTETPTPIPTHTPAPPPDPAALQWTLVASGFTRPLDVQNAGDARLFIVEQAGVIRVIEDGQLQPEPFLDIRDRVGDNALEQGLLGLAFHPQFAANGFFFLNYTDNLGDTVIARYQATADHATADPASEIILLTFDQPYANHNGGGMAFGPDGYLYIGTGDGGSRGDPLGNGQSLNTLLGKILRLDVDQGQPYAIPPDNPFAASGEIYREIWAFGLRNPWRFAFDPATGDLCIADVGQASWEEVDFQPAGAAGGVNYGWNLREGMHPYASNATAGLTDPVAEYSHAQGCSITGGVVIRSPSPPEWHGVYLYGDYCSGRIWGLSRAVLGNWNSQVLFETPFSISSFGRDTAGEVYLVDHAGAVYRLERRP
ncbi:MAG: PQQ-dependent sugar dehydrogenase [Chloroflexota bacterium]